MGPGKSEKKKSLRVGLRGPQVSLSPKKHLNNSFLNYVKKFMVIKFEQFDVSSLGFEQVKVSPKDTVLLPRVQSGECPLFQLLWCVSFGVPKLSN